MNGINLTDQITTEQHLQFLIGNLLHNQMILTPVAIDAHGRLGPITRQNLYGTPPPDVPPRKQFKPNRPIAKTMNERATTLPAPIGIFIEVDQRWKQIQADHPQHNHKFYGLSHYAPTPSITTIQQLGLGIAHTFSTFIIMLDIRYLWREPGTVGLSLAAESQR